MAYGRDGYVPYLMHGGKIDPLQDIRNAGIVTSGDVYWVKAVTDPDFTSLGDAVGKNVLLENIQDGIDKTTSDQNDYVLVTPSNGGTVFTIGTAIDLDEDRVHLINVGYTQAAIGYSNTIRGFATASGGTPVDSSMVDVTGNACEMAGFRILGTAGTSAGGTVSQLLYVQAHNFWMHDCAVEANDSAADTSMLSGLGTKHGARFDNVTFAQLGTEDSPATPINIPNGAQRWVFNDCDFLIHASATGDEFVNAGTGLTYYTAFNRCNFINSNAGTAPASVVIGSVTVDDGVVLMNECSGVNVTQMGTDPTVFVAPAASGTAAAITNPYLSTGTAAIAPA